MRLTPVLASIERLSPGYFALVMSTGIVSIGLRLVGFDGLSNVLLAIAGIAYAVLWVLYLWRAIAFRREMLHDLRDPSTAFSYFTIVAGTGVLAVGLLQAGLTALALPLVLFTAVLWFVFGYLLPWQVFMTRDDAPILSRTNGTWFVWVVASQSLAICMAKIQPNFDGTGAELAGLLAVLSWSVGVVLYAGVSIFVLLRIIHYGVTAEEFEPPYWVTMGAMAIAVVAGSSIVDLPPTPVVDATRGLIAATVVVFWSFCAWLIPLLIGAGVWRHVFHRVPLWYTAALWTMVFPMGMFAVASITLGRVDGLPAIEVIGEVSLVIAVAVWAMVFVAMLWSVFRKGASGEASVAGERGAAL